MDNNSHLSIAQEAQMLDETLFRVNEGHGDLNAVYPLVKKGALPVVISAPHAVRQYLQDGTLHENELGTGSLALQLARATGASAIVYNRTTYPPDPDPNRTKPGLYKLTLKKLVEETGAFLVLDIHSMDDSPMQKHGLGQVEIGTANRQALRHKGKMLGILREELQRYDISVTVDQYFTGSISGAITSYVRDAIPSASAMQLEIIWWMLRASNWPERYITLFAALRDAVIRMN